MNEKQKNVAVCAGVVIALMLAFPPFAMHGANGSLFNLGYSFITNPPRPRATINIQTLLVQWFFVASLAGIAYKYFHE